MSALEENSSALWSGSGAVSNDADNFTSSCAAENIQGPVELPYSETVLTTARVFQSLFYFVVVLFGGSFLNGFVIVLVVRYKKLHTLSFAIALQVLVLNLVSSIVYGIIVFVGSVANRWVFGEYACAIVGMFALMVVVSRASMMFVFVFDRFFTVFFPFRYPKYQKKVAIALSVLSWAFAILTSGIALALDCYTFKGEFLTCLYSSTCNSKCLTYTIVLFGAFLGPITIVPVVFYIALFIKGRQASKALSVHAVSADQNKRSMKATITFFTMFLTVFALVLPVSAITFLIRVFSQGTRLSAVLHFLNILNADLFAFIVFTDPLVILRNGDVRAVVKNVKTTFKMKFRRNDVSKPETLEMKTKVTVDQ